MKYLRDTSMAFLSGISAVPLAFLTSVIIARTIGPEGKGIVALVRLIPGFSAMFINLGLETASSYYVSRSPDLFRRLFANLLYSSLGLGMLLASILYVGRKWILVHGLGELATSYFVLSIVCIPLLAFSRCAISLFQGMQRFKLYSFSKLLQPLFNLFFALLFIQLMGLGILGGALLPASCLSATFAVNLLLLVMIDKPRLLPDFDLLWRSFRYGIRAQMGVFLNFFNLRLDNFILNFFKGTGALGVYTVGVSLAELLWHIPQALSATLFPKVAAIGSEEATNFTSAVLRNSLVVMVPCAVLLAVIGKHAIRIVFGEAFLGSYVPLVLLLPGVVALGIAKIISGDLHGRGKPEYGAYLSVVSLVFTVGLDLLLIPRMGIVGAAVASSVAYCSSCVAAVLLFRKETSRGLASLFTWKREDTELYCSLVKSAVGRIPFPRRR